MTIQPICRKSTYEYPPTSKEELSCLFFERPLRGLENRVYTLKELEKKINGREYLTANIIDRVSKGLPILTSLRLEEPAVSCYYTPSALYLQKIAHHYLEKYGFNIQIIPIERSHECVLEYSAKPGAFSVGVILYSENTFHITPLLLHKTADESYHICILDCMHSLHLLRDNLTSLLSLDHVNLWASKGTRLSDGYSCRLEGMSLLKHLLLWINTHPDTNWFNQINSQQELILSTPVRAFKVPAIWDPAAQCSGSVQLLSKDHDTVINHKGTTYEAFKSKYYLPITVQCLVIDPETQEECSNTFKTPMNMFLLLKAQKYVQKLLSEKTDAC